VESAAGPVGFVDVGTIDCPAGTKMSKLTAYRRTVRNLRLRRQKPVSRSAADEGGAPSPTGAALAG
jgi:hypothetical protein